MHAGITRAKEVHDRQLEDILERDRGMGMPLGLLLVHPSRVFLAQPGTARRKPADQVVMRLEWAPLGMIR